MTHSDIVVTHLTCEYLTNPLGIDVPTPRLSWQIETNRYSINQSAYHIQVSDDQGMVWDSGKVDSCQSVLVPYRGPALISRQHYRWRVRVWTASEFPSDWSDEAWWEMGLLNSGDWQAQWIDPEGDIDPEAFKPAPYLRRTFTLDRPVRSARIYATAHGLYELHLNGHRVGDQVMTPGWTSYHHRLQYQVYDVTDLLNAGQNAIGAIIGDGWWRGKVGLEHLRNVYGERLALLLQLHITHEDGSETIVTTDEHWKTTTGPIIKSDFFDGEIYDARLEIPHWDEPVFDDRRWSPVRVVDRSYDRLIAEIAPPVRKKETFHPIDTITTPAGQTVLDFGQNISGWVRMSVNGPAGTTIKLTHGEALDKDGNFPPGVKLPIPGSDQLLQETHYTLKGQGIAVFEPHFTSQGFRYVWLEGYPGIPNPHDFTAIAIYSDMPQTGTFTCSNEQINQLHQNIVWSMKGNFMDIPTDCPTRERAGWTGDTQVFARTGSTLMQTSGFFNKWLQDLAADQKPTGLVPNTIPDPYQPLNKQSPLTITAGSSAWADAAIIVPWVLYHAYGDVEILEQQYTSMTSWFDYVYQEAQKIHWVRKLQPTYWLSANRRKNLRSLWDTGFHWGEWVEAHITFPQILLGTLKSFAFSRPTVASAYYKHIADIMTYTATILGKPTESRHYRQLSEQIRDAYVAEFIAPDGSMQPDTQASYVRVLQFDLVPDDIRPRIVAQLLRLIREADMHPGTGFLSSGWLCQVLAREGQLDVAYQLLTQETYPSWLYAVNCGATTMWEGWDNIKEDGSVVHHSFNHFARGSIAEFLYRIVAGIEIGTPGYKHIIFQPKPGGGLTWARASYHSMYGEIGAAWQIEQDMFNFKVVVPPNTTAEICLPDMSAPISVGSGKHHFSCAWRRRPENIEVGAS